MSKVFETESFTRGRDAILAAPELIGGPEPRTGRPTSLADVNEGRHVSSLHTDAFEHRLYDRPTEYADGKCALFA